MVAKSLRDTDEFKLGRNGERLVAGMLQAEGFWVIPSYDYAGEDGDKPPRLQGGERSLPVPDLDIAIGGQRRWVEVKTKSAASYTRATAQYEHGIDLYLFEAYLDVQDVTGAEVWLAFYEMDSGLVLYQSLDHLARFVRRYTGRKMGGRGMAFFPRAELLLLGKVEAAR